MLVGRWDAGKLAGHSLPPYPIWVMTLAPAETSLRIARIDRCYAGRRSASDDV